MPRICIITAVNQETKPLLKLNNAVPLPLPGWKAWHFSKNSKQTIIIQSGIGLENAAKASEMAISELKPDIMISAGFCGAITKELDQGDIVKAGAIGVLSGNHLSDRIVTDTEFTGRIFPELQQAEFITVDRIISKSSPALTSLANRTSVIEMESHAAASVCIKYSIPFAAVRAVSDPAGIDPAELFKAISDDSFNIRWQKILVLLAKKPSTVPQMLELKKSAQLAGKNLAEAITKGIERI